MFSMLCSQQAMMSRVKIVWVAPGMSMKSVAWYLQRQLYLYAQLLLSMR